MTVSSLKKATESESTEELALTDSETLDEVIKCLVENFSIETQGVCDQQTLFEILIKAAFVFVGISFLLVNIWVNLLWLRISRKRKGSRLIYRTLFTLKQMLAFLSQAPIAEISSS